MKTNFENRINFCDVDLNGKINEFLKWYQNNLMSKGENKKFFTKKLQNFIDKMAFWYTILYSDEEVVEIINQQNFNFSCHKDTYNQFCDEMTKGYLREPIFYNRLYFKYEGERRYFYLNKNYIITKTENMIILPRNINYQYETFEGKSIFEVIDFFKEHGLFLEETKAIELVLSGYVKSKYFKDELLNCIMYRIIEIDNGRIGPKRALLFAKQFGTSKEIPMIYGVDTSDPNLGNFIKFYLHEGGRKDIICINNYHRLEKAYEKVEFIPMEQLFRLEGMKEYLINKNDSTNNRKKIPQEVQPKSLKRTKK